MLDNNQLLTWVIQSKVPPHARMLIERIRSLPPSRSVCRSARGATGRYTSRKMGRTIQFGSQAVALAAVYEMEHNPETLEYWDQPPPIRLRYADSEGRPRGLIYTPDFFVIESETAGWLECKSDAMLAKLSLQMPNRYVHSGTDQWRCVPGEEYANRFGLFYRVISDREINWVFQRNLRFLEDYFNDGSLNNDSPAFPRATAVVAASPGITLAALLSDSEIRPGDVYKMIASEALHVDLHATLLTQPENVRVFTNSEEANAYTNAGLLRGPTDRQAQSTVVVASGTTILWDARPWVILNAGEKTVTLVNEQKKIAELPNDQFESLIKLASVLSYKYVE